MITFPPQQTAISKPESKSYEMIFGQNERMAGSVPVKNATFAENIAELNQESEEKPVEDNSFGISDVIDMINPLQHIPIVSNLYQSATGDKIGSVAMIVGGAIFGGPLGALTSAGIVAYRASQQNSENDGFNPSIAERVSLADQRKGYKPYNS